MFHLFSLHFIVKPNISKPNIVIQKIPLFEQTRGLLTLLNDVIKTAKI